MHVALYHPSIPPNTGNIGRLCVGMDCELHIIGPCDFDFSDKSLRRAGLDYWPHLTWTLHDSDDAFLEWLGDRQPWLVSKFGNQQYFDVSYQQNDVLMLGNEVTGIPEKWHKKWPDRIVNIPIHGAVRSYNLSNAAAIILSHAVNCGS
ncbi:MAG: tRNA (cytidine(34)-2'-O)-methyltransferase [Planctomycetes bacterium]|nr:tRNA (cytidine(34)-2'-O)-methyltransferase [Planctomycetota bacterium]